jgi:hypothetical protein
MWDDQGDEIADALDQLRRADYCRMLGGSKPSPLGDGFSVSLR